MAGLTSHPNLKTTFADNSPFAEELLTKGLNDPNTAINDIATELGNDAKNATEEAPASSASAVMNLLGQLKRAFKNIKGTTNWYDSAAATIATIWGKFNATTGHGHTGGANDAPQIATGGIANTAVTAAKIDALAVETAKIADNNVTGAKITATDGLLRTITTYTADDTWTKPSGLKFVIVEVQGAGGGGGGAAGAGGAQAAVGRGGGGGGYTKEKILVGALGATETVTVGAAGAAGASGANNGTAGGDSTFGAHSTGSGGALGVGGAASGNITSATSASGGAASGGDINIPGSSADIVARIATTAGWSGRGGDSVLGFGGGAITGTSGGGAAGTGNGSGGSGGFSRASGGAQVGAAGAVGVIIVKEYF